MDVRSWCPKRGKQALTYLKWKDWYGRKVWTVCTKDVEWISFKHRPKTQEITLLEKEIERDDIDDKQRQVINTRLNAAIQSRTFKLAPKRFTTCKLRVSPHDQVEEKQKMTCGISQIPVVSSDAITGHKLQGLTKNNIIVYSWNKATEWMYVVLSRVRTLNGLYLVRHLKLSDIVPPSRQYLAFIQRMKNMQTAELDRFRDAFLVNWLTQ